MVVDDGRAVSTSQTRSSSRVRHQVITILVSIPAEFENPTLVPPRTAACLSVLHQIFHLLITESSLRNVEAGDTRGYGH